MMMTKIIALFCILLLAACSSEQPKPEAAVKKEPPMATEITQTQAQGPAQQPVKQVRAPFSSISAHAAQKLIAEKSDLLILDTRTTKEIITYGSIAGAKQASLRAIFQNELAIPKDTPIMVICAVGGRSYAAGKIMVKHGFTEIYNLRGGLDAWKEIGLPVVYPKM